MINNNSEMINNHNKQLTERARKRDLVADTNNKVAGLAIKHGINPSKVCDDRYLGCYGMDTKQLREDGNLSSKETPLNAMSIRDLTLQSFINQMVIESDNPSLTFELAKNIRLGVEKVTNKPLKPIWETTKLKPSQAKKTLESNQLELPL